MAEPEAKGQGQEKNQAREEKFSVSFHGISFAGLIIAQVWPCANDISGKWSIIAAIIDERGAEMAKKKSYSVNWENEQAVSFEVDGVTYASLNEIPDKRDKRKLQEMMSEASEPTFDEKEWEQTQAESHKAENLILWIFGGVAALMLLITCIAAAANISKVSQEKSAAGVVVNVVQVPVYDENDRDRVLREINYPVVRYTAADGRRREVQMSEGSELPFYEAGDEVTVRYHPEHPLEARLDSFGSTALMWILPAITGILGLAFGGAVWVVKVVMK
jgi:hypothetical protein